MRTLRPRLGDEAGITLSETVVVVAIVGIVIGALAGVLSMAIRSSDQLSDQSTLQTEVRASVDQLVRDLRQAYSGDSSYPILAASGTTLEFLSPDLQVPFHNRRLAYRLTAGHFDRAITTSTDTDGTALDGMAVQHLRRDPDLGLGEAADRRAKLERVYVLRPQRHGADRLVPALLDRAACR